jgi:penicillin-binding protein 1A
MNIMLRAVVTDGTARRAQFGDFEIAGKTGTSQDYRDAWFIGYTTHLVGGVWVGNDDNSPTQKVTGGSIPAAIWKDVMEYAHASLAPEPLPGDRYGSGQPGAQVSQLQSEQGLNFGVGGGGSAAPSQSGGGFFDDLGRLFAGSSSQPDAPPGQRRAPTAFERMMHTKEK